MKVSIILPAYNVEEYIEKAIASALNQQYADFELIIVNDGSTDNTGLVISNMSKQDSRIVAIDQSNKGVSAARNAGIKVAKGQYVMFLDADDIYASCAIDKMVSKAEESDYDLVSCNYFLISENSLIKDTFYFGAFDIIFENGYDKLEFINNVLLTYKIGFEVWNKIYKRSIIEENGIEFNEKCMIGEDLLFNLEYIMHIKSAACMEERLYYYLQRGGSTTARKKDLNEILYQNILVSRFFYEYLMVKKFDLFIKNYRLFFLRLCDTVYIGHSSSEIIENYKLIGQKDYSLYEFIICRYEEVFFDNKIWEMIYPPEISTIKRMYNKYIFSRLKGYKLVDKVFFSLYDTYRKWRRRELISDWKMVN